MEAEPYYRQSLKLNPTYARAWRNLSIVLGKKGDIAEEIKSLETSLRYDPKDVIAYFDLAEAQSRAGQFEASRNNYRKALSCVPHESTEWVAMAHCQMQCGMPRAAQASLEKALQLKPDNPPALTLRAAILLSNKKYAEAEIACRQAIKIAPLRANNWKVLGIILDEKGNLKDAIAAYDRSALLEPKNAGVLLLLGAAQEREGQHSAALQKFEACSNYQSK